VADKSVGVDKGNDVYGKFRDESDGTYSPTSRARLEGWDSTGASWIKVAVSSTGAIQTSGSAGGGGAATIADGADVAQGATTDAAVVTDVAGTISGKLRGLVKWAYERMPASLGQKAMANGLAVTIASDQSDIQTKPVPGSTIATAVSSASGAAITLSLAGVASNFHYLSYLQIVAYNTAARTGGVTPVTVTTSNITGSPAFTFGSAGAVGANEIQTFDFPEELKSTTANTATTVVCPATTGVIWRVNVVYRVGT
jgi:hypothetical protein